MESFSVRDNLKAHYDEYYKEGELEWRQLGAIGKARNIVSLCREYPHREILDIGAGEGSVLKRLSDLQFGDSLYGIEISESAAEAIKQRDIRSLVEYRIFDGYSIPYEDDSFDLSILSHVVEHLEYPRKLLYEASRVARYVFVEVPLQDVFRSELDFTPDRTGHINFYSFRTIRKLVQTCGLEVLSQVTSNPSYQVYRYRSGRRAVFKWLPKELLLRIVPSLAMCLLTYHCSLVCRRS